MKITIEPTGEHIHNVTDYNTVSISIPDDDLDLDGATEIVNAALRAWGFTYANLIQEPTNEP